MNDEGGMEITLIAFGPLAEALDWKRHQLTLQGQHNVGQVLQILELSEWNAKGLITALNGIQCTLDTELKDGDELALLPPVSGA